MNCLREKYGYTRRYSRRRIENALMSPKMMVYTLRGRIGRCYSREPNGNVNFPTRGWKTWHGRRGQLKNSSHRPGIRESPSHAGLHNNPRKLLLREPVKISFSGHNTARTLRVPYPLPFDVSIPPPRRCVTEHPRSTDWFLPNDSNDYSLRWLNRKLCLISPVPRPVVSVFWSYE